MIKWFFSVYFFIDGQWERKDSITSTKSTINASEVNRYSIRLRKWPNQQYTSTQASNSGIFRYRVNAGGSTVFERQFKVSVQGK